MLLVSAIQEHYNNSPDVIDTSLSFDPKSDLNFSFLEPALQSTEPSPVISTLNFTIPEGKLFYPEPFIASPSYLHTDLTYIHLFQYWYWVWFVFVFLICFFLISFISVVRWNSNRSRPRRETRGVSRSKCGDLITACVPVSWAISIIVSESTDAADLNDGFGTSELVVGVRAYQWGWEYYYPKSIDLHHTTKSSGSSYVGHSLRYGHSSGQNLSTNYLWKMYQHKSDDKILTPAHLLLTPLDSGNATNFLSFQDIGTNTLAESNAFAKIRNSTKVYNSHLAQTNSTFSKKFADLNSLYVDENTYLRSGVFGVEKQHNLTSISSLGNTSSLTSLDSGSFNHFLSSNSLSGIESNTQNLISPLSLQKEATLNTSPDSYLANNLLSQAADSTNSTSTGLTKLTAYPELLSHVNDNSDKDGLMYPVLKTSSPNMNQATLNNSTSILTSSNSDSFTSTTNSYVDTSLNNTQLNSRVFNVSGPNSKVLAGDQSIRHFPDLQPSKSNYNVSSTVNTLTSELTNQNILNKSLTPADLSNANLIGYADSSLTHNLASTRSNTTTYHPAVLSSDPNQGPSLNYDSTSSTRQDVQFSPEGSVRKVTSTTLGSSSDAMVGARDKAPASINAAYWSTFWNNSNPNHRVMGTLRADVAKTSFYLPLFSTYSDYDFRNDQALDMLEELYWESNYSGYNFYDYMTLSKNVSNAQASTPKEVRLDKEFYTSVLGLEPTSPYLSASYTKDLSLLGEAYASGVQMEDAITSPADISTRNFAPLTLYADLNEIDDSASEFRNLNQLSASNANLLLGTSSRGLAPRSYLSVFNYFRSDFDNFSWTSNNSQGLTSLDNNLDASLLSITSAPQSELLLLDSDSDGSSLGNDIRLSNPATLRPSVRNSIVNYNAFQKVFKPRLDESRSHVQSTSFADMSQKQPFLSDSKVPYLSLLGKNRDSFFATPLYKKSPLPNLNTASTLLDSLNSPMYDFPFLLARTSDTMRFTWIDWFAKWSYLEVQPSSVSKYSTIGVPYFRKPFDFNSTTGDKFQDTESYFTRVARSRRNYLPMWKYSPFTYNRAYLWNSSFNSESLFLSTRVSNSSAKNSCVAMSWYWRLPSFNDNMSNIPNYTISGDDIYGKSTWRPQSSIQAYYYKLGKLTDILSRREHLYRRYLDSAMHQKSLPNHLTATPQNPLLADVRASFQFNDPSSFSSEYSRDFMYSSLPHFQFLQLRSALATASTALANAPLNASPLTEYVFYYLLGSDSQKAGNYSELYKNQYRPLRKGISDMLRLHATGAIAMPIEIRLQVLASSRDVIHSWAIPSASIKIDCVPGYTSHRIMKFNLVGVYWGQCQEICGRYHHWMPIVCIFMRSDLFFLWCNHYVNRTTASDALYTSPINFLKA